MAGASATNRTPAMHQVYTTEEERMAERDSVVSVALSNPSNVVYEYAGGGTVAFRVGGEELVVVVNSNGAFRVYHGPRGRGVGYGSHILAGTLDEGGEK